jgi:hypothetical protein
MQTLWSYLPANRVRKGWMLLVEIDEMRTVGIVIRASSLECVINEINLILFLAQYQMINKVQYNGHILQV